ncbi:MAG TPA: Uma2 family endonuclease [Candidatus Saccharimonadales bacterium]|nr:Uma2 family endonuclease [Candidatus Saccharimonadales bacterium]
MSISTEDKNILNAGYLPIVVHLQPVLNLSDEQLYDFSQINRDLQIEHNQQGELVIIPPTGGDTGERNAEITMQLRLWAKRDGTGTTFDSSTGFRLPNGAIRSPDAAWIKHSRLNELTTGQRKRFIPLCPDFVIEIRSPTDNLITLQEKMQEYIANGAEMGLLLDTEQRRVYIYKPDEQVQEVENPDKIICDSVLSGFELNPLEIW